MTTAARVYALELQSQIDLLADTRIRDAAKWKVTGEFTPGKATKVGGGVMFDTDYVSGEVTHSLLDIDLAAKNPKDRFKLLTATVKLGTGNLAELKFPGALQFMGKRLDLKVRLKVSGTIDVGPRWEALDPELVKMFGEAAVKAFRASAVEMIAREEASMAIELLSEKLAAEATDGITDPALRAVARAQAKERALAEAGKQGIKGSILAVMLEQRALPEAARIDLTAARMAMRTSAAEGAREVYAAVGRSVIREAVKDTLRISGRRIWAAIGGALALGPVDVALIGLDLLTQVVVEALRTDDAMDAGMTAQVIRDNYVAGYRDALAGKGGGGAPAAGGRASPEGAALAAGLSDGAGQFTKVLDAAMHDRPEVASGLITRDEIVGQVKQLMTTLPVDESKIVGLAGPRLEQMMINAYVEANTGLLDRLFGVDPRDSRSFDDFLRNVRSNLSTWASHTVTANLANGVKVQVIALDRTGENARRFRTADGAWIVRLGGYGPGRSGWITMDGQPLEELYGSQTQADGADAGGPAFEQRMGELLAASSLRLIARFDGSSMRAEGLMVSGPGGTSAEFTQYMRTAPALGRTVGSFAAVTVASTYMPTGGHPGSLWIHKRGSGVVGGDRAGAGNANLRRFARQLGVADDGLGLADAVARHLYDQHVAGTRLSAFPTPTLAPG